MNHKRIYYWVTVPHMWWVRGIKKPLDIDDPLVKKKGASSSRTFRSLKAVCRALRHCPAGTEIIRLMHIRGKRPRRDILNEWVRR